jgi:LmbE family N-acetylglucosaminyl deacetylase
MKKIDVGTLPMRLPKRIRWKHIQRIYEGIEPFLKAAPLKLSALEHGNVLVMAPHIDDDVIGCGGTLRKHVDSGQSVMSVYFADCTDTRKTEAAEAAAIIGINRLEFLGYESKTLLDHPEIQDRLSDIIAEYKPKIVYLPSLLDRHNDHLTVNHYMAALCASNKFDFNVYSYEVWTALVPNMIVDISSTVDKKKAAIACYKSQIVSTNWLDAALSLNRYRAITSGAGDYAEGFMRYSARKYLSFWKRVYGK